MAGFACERDPADQFRCRLEAVGVERLSIAPLALDGRRNIAGTGNQSDTAMPMPDQVLGKQYRRASRFAADDIGGGPIDLAIDQDDGDVLARQQRKTLPRAMARWHQQHTVDAQRAHCP